MANNIEKLVGVFAAQIQELETAALEVLIETRLDNAVGVQLDTIGTIVGIARSNENDDRYRELISAQIRINLASGTIPEVLEILEIIVGATIDLELIEYYPAAFEVEALQQPLAAGKGENAALILKSAKAAGVKGLFQWYESDPLFRLDGSGGSKLDGGYYLSTSL